MKRDKKFKIKLTKYEKNIEKNFKLGLYKSLGKEEVKKHIKYAKDFIQNYKNKKNKLF